MPPQAMPTVRVRRGSRGSSRGSLHQHRRQSGQRRPVVSSSVSSVSSTTQSRSVSMPPRRATATTSVGRRVALTDQQLVAMAHKSLSLIRWNRILGKPGPHEEPWKWRDSRGAFEIFQKRDAHHHGVLAVGTVPCSIPELVHILEANDAHEFAQKMEALQGDAQFRHGAFLHDVDLAKASVTGVPEMRSEKADKLASSLLRVSVKSATFHKSRWFASHDQWSYVDTLHRDEAGGIVEKLMISLDPADVAVKTFDYRTKALKHVIAGYMMRPVDSASVNPAEDEAPSPDLPPGLHPILAALAQPIPRARRPSTQVHFYGEALEPRHFQFARASSSSSSSSSSLSSSFSSFSSTSARTSSLSQASGRAARARLQAMAESCERLTELVRRRRLGVQVLVDANRFFPPTNTPCHVCARHLLVAKLCRLCGHGVCDKCSHKYSRDRQVRGSPRTRVEMVRICEPCMARVDVAVYQDLPPSSLASPRVVPDPDGAQAMDSRLIELLQDALLHAPSGSAKASILSVIRTLLDQDKLAAQRQRGHPQRRSTRLTPSSSEQAHLDALQNELHAPVVPADQCALANEDGREYVIQPDTNVDRQLPYPVPENEEHRVRVIKESKMREMGRVEELQIICRLAAQEMGCFASMVTIIDRDEQYIAASNLDAMVQQSMLRTESFCQHTIMGEKPLVLPHMDADIRCHQSGPVRQLGLNFYCGFPVLAEDNTIVGSVCCIDHKSREITASQYTAMAKLAETASKVIKVQTTRLRAASMSSQASR